MEIILDTEEVAVDAIALAVKSLGIIDWKIYKEGKKSYYQIIRADGKSQMYMFFSQMLTSYDKDDLEDLYKLTMFELHVEDAVWRKQQRYKVLEWKLYDSVGDEEVVVGEGVAVTYLSLKMLTNNYLGGIMVSLIFLEGLEEEALVEFMVVLFEEDEDGKKNEKDGLFNLRENDQSRKA
uniref:Uncharacterized protein n=1 Tax=Tanacetum cinerariifolium TaxID=118510 RepID=A0A6L2KZF5_TANCI|nr:hypothetical protein [Tanacetum cinerariifolium]